MHCCRAELNQGNASCLTFHLSSASPDEGDSGSPAMAPSSAIDGEFVMILSGPCDSLSSLYSIIVTEPRISSLSERLLHYRDVYFRVSGSSARRTTAPSAAWQHLLHAAADRAEVSYISRPSVTLAVRPFAQTKKRRGGRGSECLKWVPSAEETPT